MTKIAITYAAPDETLAQRLADDLHNANYELAELGSDTILVAVISADALQDDELNQTIVEALDMSLHVVLVQTTALEIPELYNHLKRIDFSTGYKLRTLQQALDALAAPGIAPPLRVLTPNRRAANQRVGLLIGGFVLILFAVYTVAIALYDIEAPQEQFALQYTRDAATINAFAQEFVPRTTEQADAFDATLQAPDLGDELATLVVATVTQAAADGGFTPIPTGLIIAEQELSEVRQIATQTAAARDFDGIAATATEAAAQANATLTQAASE